MDAETPTLPDLRAPKVSFVSLGCPKALVDSERIVTRLRAEGYELARAARGRRPRDRQHLRLSRQRPGGIARRHRRGARGERQGDRDRLHGRRAREDHRGLSGRARGHRAAAIRERGRGGASGGAAAPRPVPRSGAARGHQAHAAALRLSQDFRGLQQSLHVLHHPAAARRPGVAPGRRRAARGRAAGRGRRQGAAGHLAGHLGLRDRSQIRGERMEGPRGARQVPRSRPRARRARRLGAAALRLSLPARRRGHPADGGAARCCPISTSRSSTRARTCCGA